MKVTLAQLNPTVGLIEANADKIITCLHKAKDMGSELVLFSELALCGYPPEDLLYLPDFMERIHRALLRITDNSGGIAAIVGTVRGSPFEQKSSVHNSAAIISNRRLLGFYDKQLLPTYDVFDERRYFTPGEQTSLWNLSNHLVGITICEDMWQHSALLQEAWYSKDPILSLSPHRPRLLLNLSASPYSRNKLTTRLKVLKRVAYTLRCPVLFCNQVGGNDSLLFDGYSSVLNSQGEVVWQARGFEEELFTIDTDRLPLPIHFEQNILADLYSALVMGVRDYFKKSGLKKAVLGLSGGIDSALVACIAVKALGRENLLCVALPSRFSSSESFSDARKLAANLQVELKEISIEELFSTYLGILNPHFHERPPDETEENLQSRIRGTLLMAISNKLGHTLLNTGNKSELAMGYCTLYGDMCGALAVIGDLYKEDIYALAEHVNLVQEIIPQSIINKAPSAELRHGQKDSDTLPEYPILDTIIKSYIEEHQSIKEICSAYGYSKNLVTEIISRMHRNEFKRRQSALILRTTDKALTPSAGRKVPVVNGF